MSTKTSYAFSSDLKKMDMNQQMIYRGGHMSSSQSSADTQPSGGHKSSSLDSDNDVRNVQHPFTLHLVTDPGLSDQVSRSYRNLIACMEDRSLSGIIQVCERQESWSRKKSQDAENKTPRIPSLALVLFCYDHPSPSSGQHYDVSDAARRARDKDDDGGDADEDSAFYDYEQQNHPTKQFATYAELRRRLTKRPWTFHHKVNISGSMMMCDSNVQDFYRYEEPKSSGVSLEKKEDFPLFAVRKVHTGRPVLRATIFVSSRKWREQIAFYARLSGCKAAPVRDDFCLLEFEAPQGGSVQLQLGLKKLPEGLRPKALASTFIEFDVTSMDMIALTPNVLEPMSELRMRTRDHDGNTVILSIDERLRREMTTRRRVGRSRHNPETRRSRSVSPYVNNNNNNKPPTTNTNDVYFTNSPNGNRRPTVNTLTRTGRDQTRRSSRQFLQPNDTRLLAHGDGSPKPTSRSRRRANRSQDDEATQHNLYTRLKPKTGDKKPDGSSGKSSPSTLGRRSKLSSTFATSLSSANDSFTYPCLPERMPLLKQDAYVTLQGSKKEFDSPVTNRFTQDSSKDEKRRSQLMSSSSSISSSSNGGKKSLSVRLNEGFYV